MKKAEAKNAGKVTTQMINTFYIGEIQQKSFGYSENLETSLYYWLLVFIPAGLDKQHL